jgi:hypothetical protein
LQGRGARASSVNCEWVGTSDALTTSSEESISSSFLGFTNILDRSPLGNLELALEVRKLQEVSEIDFKFITYIVVGIHQCCSEEVYI